MKVTTKGTEGTKEMSLLCPLCLLWLLSFLIRGSSLIHSQLHRPAAFKGGSVYKAGLVLAFLLLSAPVFAQMNLDGEWAGRYHEDQTDRVPGDVQGDFSGVPMNDAARRYAESFDVTRVNLLEHQCEPYNLPHIYRGPLQFRIWEDKDPATQEVIAYRQYLGTYQQWRTIWMDGRAHPPEYAPHTFMGFS